MSQVNITGAALTWAYELERWTMCAQQLTAKSTGKLNNLDTNEVELLQLAVKRMYEARNQLFVLQPYLRHY